MRIERYAYDRAGRLVREGNRTYRYGYLDKVLSVTDGKRSYRYAYHVDGQLARADYGEGVGDGGRAGSPLPAGSEAFLWDGLALVRRGDESFVNEPHVGDAPKKLRFGGKPRAKRSARRARKGSRGNPVVSSKGATYFNDALGTTVGVREGRGASRKGAKRRYTAAALTAFGVAALAPQGQQTFFTGKPQVEGLGRVFLYRNYRADLAKWQTADPLGYPDGWNQLAYCGNEVTRFVDLEGACKICPNCGSDCPCLTPHYYYPEWFHDNNNKDNLYCLGRDGFPVLNPNHPFAKAIEDYFPNAHYFAVVHDSWVDALGKLAVWDAAINIPTMPFAFLYAFGINEYNSYLNLLDLAQRILGLNLIDIDRLRIDPIILYQCSCME